MNKKQAVKVLHEGIKKYSPVVAEFFDREDKLINYSKNLYNFEVDAVHLERQRELKKFLNLYTSKIYYHDFEVSEPLAINIVDHHAILNHPILIATNIVANAQRIFTKYPPINTFSSSIVPPDNFFNRGGFNLHGKKVSLFTKKVVHQAGCFIEKMDFSFTGKLKRTGQWGEFNQNEQDFLSEINAAVQEVDFAPAHSYSEQISLLNKYLWSRLFDEVTRKSVPELNYIPNEEIARIAFPKVFLENNLISKILFDESFREKVIERFDGLTGCWDVQNEKGSVLFWYRNEKNEAGRLVKRGNSLISKDGKFKVNLEASELIDNITNKNIIPNLFLIYTYISFWCGVRPLVGHGSSNYLTKMKETLLDILKDEDAGEYSRVTKVDTKGLIGGSILTFARNELGQIANQYAFDIIASGGMSKKYLENLLDMKFKDLLGPALLEIYESYVPASERVDLGLDPHDLMGNAFDWIT